MLADLDPMPLPRESRGVGLHAVSMLLPLALLVGCSDSGTEVEETTLTVELSSSNVSLTVLGETAHLTASVLDVDGDPVTDRSVTWSSTDGEVATVVDGLVTATGNGSAIIAATIGSASARATVQVDDIGWKISFDSDRDGDADVYLMNADGSDVLQLTDSPGADGLARLSPDRSRFAFVSSRDGDFEVYLMDADGSNPVNLSNAPGAQDFDPSWSPDGSKIAFQSSRDGNLDIFSVNVDGSDPINLTAHAAIDRDPEWSPDGSRIVFISDRDGASDVWVIDPDGSDPLNLTNGSLPESESPSWSPDASRIAFDAAPAGDNNREIHVMDADGANVVRLTDAPGMDSRPTWSPDGTRIAFTTSRDGAAEIYVMDADGSNPVNISENPAADADPKWGR